MTTENTNPNFVASFCGQAARKLKLPYIMTLKANAFAVMGARLKEQKGVYSMQPTITVEDKQSEALKLAVDKIVGYLNEGDLAKVQVMAAELIEACKGTGPGTLSNASTEAFRALFPNTEGKLTEEELAAIDAI